MSKLKSLILGLRIKLGLNALKRTIGEKLRMSVVQAPKYIKEEIITKKVTEANHWYTKILGLDEVKNYQQRVIILQEKLLRVQDKRREVGYQLTKIRNKSNELQDQLHKIKRQDNLQKYMNLLQEETEILQLEMKICHEFNVIDREEREIFTAYTNAVKDSHEKQRAQIEYTKYFGIILSILGSFLTFFFSAIRKKDLKNYIDERLGPKEIVNVLPTINKTVGKDVTDSIDNEIKELLKSCIQNQLMKEITSAHQGTPAHQERPAHQETPLEIRIFNQVLVALGGYIFLKVIIG